MHTLATLGFLAIGLFAAVVIFVEVRRKRHYIAYLLRYHPDELRTPEEKRADLREGIITGLVLGVVAAVILVLA